MTKLDKIKKLENKIKKIELRLSKVENMEIEIPIIYSSPVDQVIDDSESLDAFHRFIESTVYTGAIKHDMYLAWKAALDWKRSQNGQMDFKC